MARSTKTQQSTEEPVQSTQDIPGVTDESTQQVATRPADELAPEMMHTRLFEEGDLRNIDSFEAALQLAAGVHGDLADASKEIGDGFALLDEAGKRRLVGVPLIFMEWSFYDGDYGSKFVAARVVARNPDGGVSKYIINDGSTGICDMLAKYQKETGRFGGLVARMGLRASEYTYCAECGSVVNPDIDAEHRRDHKAATTYYIDTSAPS